MPLWMQDSLPASFVNYLETYFVKLLIFILAYLGFRIILALARHYSMKWFSENKKDNEGEVDTEFQKRFTTMVSLIFWISKISLTIIFIFILLGIHGINLTPLLAGASVFGLIIGFGSQEIMKDFLSGFFILMENQIRTGDVAIVNGTGGLVESISLRTIVLRDFHGVVHIIPNGKIASISNMTKEWSAAVLDIGVSYNTNIDKVIKIMTEVGLELREHPEVGVKIINDIEVVGLENFGASELVIRCRIQTKPLGQWAVGRAYRKALKERFDKEGIEIPFPQRVVTMVNEGQELSALKPASKRKKN